MTIISIECCYCVATYADTQNILCIYVKLYDNQNARRHSCAWIQGISATTTCSPSHNDDSLQLFWNLPNRLVIRFTPVTTHTETTTQYESPFYTLDTLSLACSSHTRSCARARPAVGGSEFSFFRVLVISLLAHRHIDVPLACKRQYVIIRVDSSRVVWDETRRLIRLSWIHRYVRDGDYSCACMDALDTFARTSN
jgi:hypothetical protein